MKREKRSSVWINAWHSKENEKNLMFIFIRFYFYFYFFVKKRNIQEEIFTPAMIASSNKNNFNVGLYTQRKIKMSYF